MLRLQHVTFSCDDPGRVSEFWAALLGYERAAAGSSWLATDPRGEDVRLLFNKMAKSETIDNERLERMAGSVANEIVDTLADL